MLKKLILTLSLSFLAFADENASKEVIVKFIQDNAENPVRLVNPIETSTGFFSYVDKGYVTVKELDNILELYFDAEFTHNQLLEIPKEIKYLINLRTLSLNNNLIKELPSEIGNLTKLITLRLNNNNLEKLPKEIANLKDLVILYLASNNLKEFPNEIANFTHLRDLMLNYNQIEELPSEIGNLVQLRYLSLDNNKLKELPEGICNLGNLEKLYLNSNNLKSIPDNIGNLINLKILNLSNNDLRDLPQSIGNICVKNYFGYRFSPISNICNIDVSNNKLSYLLKEIADIELFDCFDCYKIDENSKIGLKFENNFFYKLPLSFKNIKLGMFFVDGSGFNTWSDTTFEEMGYEFYSLLIDYSFESNKTISLKPLLGDDFNITSYLWGFGDGNSSTKETPIHTYSNYGDYNVTLTLNSGEYNASKLISLYPRVLELKKGWNMITSPSKDDINATLFEILWSYEDGSWDNNHSFLKPSIGYWVKLNQDLNYSYSGEVYRLPNYKIKNGWNFLGSGEKYFRETNQTIYQFKNEEWIINSDEVKAGEGFWIKKE